MARILILIILGWILYLIIKRVIAKAKTLNTTPESDKKPDEKMLLCAQCGCHVPESETQLINSKIICNNPQCRKIANGA